MGEVGEKWQRNTKNERRQGGKLYWEKVKESDSQFSSEKSIASRLGYRSGSFFQYNFISGKNNV